jgi:hypothetical protein
VRRFTVTWASGRTQELSAGGQRIIATRHRWDPSQLESISWKRPLLTGERSCASARASNDVGPHGRNLCLCLERQRLCGRESLCAWLRVAGVGDKWICEHVSSSLTVEGERGWGGWVCNTKQYGLDISCKFGGERDGEILVWGRASSSQTPSGRRLLLAVGPGSVGVYYYT